ncbi:MAG: hypothetical protein EOO05_00350 [Chitinophagaceae bacterium]|nr:MAG: hypothetical protein EOO05_00350 [Chitinophagaceae bacterium]
MSSSIWYALHTKPRAEKKVADTLGRKGFKGYFPCSKAKVLTHGRYKMVNAPVFPGIVLVKCLPGDLSRILRLDGVLNLVYWLDQPVAVRDLEVEMIMNFASKYQDIKTEKTTVATNGMARMINGSLMEQVQQQVAFNNILVKLVVPSLGVILTAQPLEETIQFKTVVSYKPSSMYHEISSTDQSVTG